MGAHDGHRQRQRRKFLEHGLDVMADHEVLELLLFYCIPRQDTNALAHRLLDTFKTLDAVLDASVAALMQVEGVGENTACMLKLMPAIDRRYQISKAQKAQKIVNSAEAARYLWPYYIGAQEERFLLLCLDISERPVLCRELARGTQDQVEVSVRKLVEYALQCKAFTVIVSHNHLNQSMVPSREDELTTLRIRDALHAVGIGFTDHIIIAESEYLSLADSGFFRTGENRYRAHHI